LIKDPTSPVHRWPAALGPAGAGREAGEVDAGVLAALADLLLPRECAGCGVPGAVLCRRCAALLAVPHLAQPRRFPAGFPPTVAAGAYAGPVRPAVNAFKERGRAELARPLGAALALAVAGVLAGTSPRPGKATRQPPRAARNAERVWCETPRWRSRRSAAESRGASTGSAPRATAALRATAAAMPPCP